MNLFVGGGDDHSMDDGLADEGSIKRVAVESREGFGLECRRLTKPHRLDPMAFSNFRDVPRERILSRSPNWRPR